MTKLERIASDHRVRVRQDSCGDPIIPGKNGHLYTDEGAVCVCFTDDGRKRPFSTKIFKTLRMKVLQPFLVRLLQDGDYECTAEIRDEAEAIKAAIRVLGVKRRKVTFGVSRPLSPGLLDHLSAKGRKGQKTRRDDQGGTLPLFGSGNAF